jgi:uncharacterized protein YycO
VIFSAPRNKHKNISVLSIALIFLSLSIILPTDSPNTNIGSYSIDTSILKDGDVIFRRGTSFVSNMVLMADKNSPYSHTGIVKIIQNTFYVVHSVPAEEPGGKDLAKIELLESFLRRDRATAVAVYRLKIENNHLSNYATEIAYNYANKKTPFDSDFNLIDDSRLYCTELVWKSYLLAGIDLVDSTFNNINIPLSEGPYILPGTLLKSKYLKPIYSINFQ